MKFPRRSSLGIKQTILLLTIVPSLLITTALTSYLILSRQTDAEQNLITNVSNIINYLAKSSELPLFSGDEIALKRIALATVSNNDTKSVTFYGSDRKLIYSTNDDVSKNDSSQNNIYTEDSLYKQEQDIQWLLQVPVYNSVIEVDDYSVVQVKDDSEIKFLGWVEVTADKSRLKERQRSILLFGITIGAFIFSFLAFLAQRFSHSLTTPLGRITETLKELESGDLSSRVNVDASGEMNDLVQGINQLASEVQISQVNLQKNVDLATVKLTNALDDLEVLNSKLKTNVIQEREQREEQEQMLLRQCRMANMGEMLDSIAHQWRQPLMHINSILMNMDNALETKPNNKEYLDKKIDDVASLTSHMSQTIEDFRDLFRLENEQTKFVLGVAIEDVLALMKNSFKDVELTHQSEPNLSIRGFRSELIQVIIILLSNSVEALSQRGINDKKIIINIASIADNVIMSIEDNAGGIQPEKIQSIFDPYFTTKEQSGGTGLGLYIAKIIIEQKMKGEISAVNTDSGVKFTISLKGL